MTSLLWNIRVRVARVTRMMVFIERNCEELVKMAQKPRQIRTPDYVKGYRFGYVRGVQDLAELIAPLVSMGQFHEIAERWEQFKKQQEQGQRRNG